MKRKSLLVLVFAVLVCSGAFAQLRLSIGLGGSLPLNYNTISDGGEEVYKEDSTSLGVYAFFDVKYIEASIGIYSETSSTYIRGEYDGGGSYSYVSLGLYGKLPIELGRVFTLSPMLGIRYDIGLSGHIDSDRIPYGGMEIPDEYVADYVNRFWIKIGASADINLGEHFFIRPTFLWGPNFGTKVLRDMKDAGPSSASGFYHGLDIKLALGIRF